MNPFDFLKAINESKEDLMAEPDNEKAYVPFVVNRSLSYFQDTVHLANALNQMHHLDNKLQFQFLLNIVRKRKRFSKWDKPTEIGDLDAVKEYYGYSNEKARQAITLLSADQITIIKNKVSKGGRK
jgi:hypothetical protein